MHKAIRVLKSIHLVDIAEIFVIFVLAFGVGKVFGVKIGVAFLIIGVGIYFVKDYIDWWAPQVHQTLVIILIFAIGIYFGQMIGNNKYWVFAILGGGVYLALLFKRPEYILLIAAILITNMFALLPPDFMQLRGFFKLRDLLLIGILLPIIAKELVERENIKFIFGSISAKAVLAFCGMILLFIIFTAIRYSYPLDLSFRIGRDYFYYLFFFAALYCGRRRPDITIKAMIGLSVLFAVLYIAQALSGGAWHILRAIPIARRSIIWYVPLVRSYAPFGFVEPICYGMLAAIVFRESIKARLWNIIGVVLVLMALFFTLGRTAWYRVITVALLILLFMPTNKKKVYALLLLTIASAFVFSLGLIGAIRYGAYKVLLVGGIERAQSGIIHAIHPFGSFADRLQSFILYYQEVIKKNLLFGLGFLYPESEITATIPYRTVVYGESSFVAILNTTGITGLVMHILLHTAFVVRGVSVLRQINNPMYKGFIIGFIAWYVGDWISVFTTLNMTRFDALTVKALIAGLVECMYYADKLERSRKPDSSGNSEYYTANIK